MRSSSTIAGNKKELEKANKLIAELQHSPVKPKIPPGTPPREKKKRKKRSKSTQSSKLSRLPIHKEEIIKLEAVPEGAVFKGYQNYLVQEIQLSSQNILFKLERWCTTKGTYHSALLPEAYKGHHFGPVLRTFIASQYNHARVTQPRLLAQLRDFGIEISAAQLNAIILDPVSIAEEEMLEILKTAIPNSAYIQTDDTGARDQGKNRICTQIGNPFFTFLKTTDSKSRINFLELLNTTNTYVLNETAISYLRQHGSKKLINQIENIGNIQFESQAAFISHLEHHYIQGETNRRLVTAGKLGKD